MLPALSRTSTLNQYGVDAVRPVTVAPDTLAVHARASIPMDSAVAAVPILLDSEYTSLYCRLAWLVALSLAKVQLTGMEFALGVPKANVLEFPGDGLAQLPLA